MHVNFQSRPPTVRRDCEELQEATLHLARLPAPKGGIDDWSVLTRKECEFCYALVGKAFIDTPLRPSL